MGTTNFFSNFISKLIRKFFETEAKPFPASINPEKVLIVRQHNQFGDMLASVSLFRAVKETYPEAELTVIVSPDNYYAITKNKFVDRYFIFDKKKLLNPVYLTRLWKVLKHGYDLAVTPATVSISSTSCLLNRFSDAKLRVGPASLNGKKNEFDYLFNVRIPLNWYQYPDAHVSDFGLDILRPLGINTKTFRSSISFDEEDTRTAKNFIASIPGGENPKVIGLHVGAGKPNNRWAMSKFEKIINRLSEKYDAKFYITGSSSDKREIEHIRNNIGFELGYFINKQIPQLAALIAHSDLFITNDTGVMHVAGTTTTPQVSIFGPTNPFNWAPVGPNKYFVRKSDLIDDVTVDDVYNLCKMLLKENGKKDDEQQ